jgi:hypothetical protein
MKTPDKYGNYKSASKAENSRGVTIVSQYFTIHAVIGKVLRNRQKCGVIPNIVA